MKHQNLEKAALRGEPSYVWREGQERRLKMIMDGAGAHLSGCILVNGCGVGTYLDHLTDLTDKAFGLDIDFERVSDAHRLGTRVLCAAGEHLPFADAVYDLILSNEVLEHVQDDAAAIKEMVRAMKTGGCLVLFCPNRWYPFETHGFYWRGKYHFGNIPLINYLPGRWRDKLAPHVRVYTRRDLMRLFEGLPVRFIKRRVIFGGYDNIIARWPRFGKFIRGFWQALEHTPLRIFGLSHFWLVEKVG
ncbi:MAG: class I SAM-dependent methyltransferase [Chloroflexota bacterium]